jgi:tetratricopeptide (TPR) repeat protein
VVIFEIIVGRADCLSTVTSSRQAVFAKESLQNGNLGRLSFRSYDMMNTDGPNNGMRILLSLGGPVKKNQEIIGQMSRLHNFIVEQKYPGKDRLETALNEIKKGRGTAAIFHLSGSIEELERSFRGPETLVAGEFRNVLGEIYSLLGMNEEAADMFFDAGINFGMIPSFSRDDEIHAMAGAKAEQAFLNAKKIYVQLSNLEGESEACLGLARLFAKSGDSQKALDSYFQAYSLAKNFGAPYEVVTAVNKEAIERLPPTMRGEFERRASIVNGFVPKPDL